jgi:hypothetical protein
VKHTGIDFEIYPRDARIKVHRQRYQNPPPINKRGLVTEFSDKSRNRLLFCAFNAKVEWLGFITLTYPAEFPTDGSIVRGHRNTFLIYLRREYPFICYLWALEFQTRGAPHIHLLVDQFIDIGWLSETWYRVVGSKDEKHLRAGTSIEFVRGREHGASYLAKTYTAKRDQKQVPEEYLNVGRFWGASRDLVVALQKTSTPLDAQGIQTVRALRRFVEKKVQVKRLRHVSERPSKSRYVKRKKKLKHLHTGLNGFTAYNGAKVGAQLLDSMTGITDNNSPQAENDEKGENNE